MRAQISDPIPRVVTRGNAGTDQAVERPMLGTAMEKKASIGNRYCQARRKRKQGKKDKGSLSVVISTDEHGEFNREEPEEGRAASAV